MRRTAAILLATLFAACQDAPTVPPASDASRTVDASGAGAPQALRDRYIVLLREGADPEALGRATTSAAGGRLHFIYRHALNGFAATLPAAAVEALRGNPNVTRIEPDFVAHALGSGSASAASWGLDRIDQRSGLNGAYSWMTSGAGVTVYILDTGIRFSHAEFAGRAQPGFDAIGDDRNGNDCHGHGTHVAGTVGGATYGVARDVMLVSVRVLGCNGSGPFSGVIAGVDWVTANHSGPSVANMSLGAMDLFGTATAVDLAVRNSIGSGVSYALAAGNDGFDACYYTPARVAEGMTVGATDQSDFRAYFSNYGSCVDWFAPGVGIRSAWNTADDATNTISGTSMATPHTTGVAALYLELQPAASAAAVRSAVFDASTKGIVGDAASANNHLLYSLLGGSPPPPPPPGNQLPAAGFAVSCDLLACTFTDQSTDGDGTVVSWSWTFGDGGTSTARSPSHTYAAEGTYAVSLTVTDDDGATNTTSQSVSVAAANQPPAAAFTYSCAGLACNFTDQSTDSDGMVISWLWEFGDGSQGYEQSPSHTFAAAGTYRVTLTAIDGELATGSTTREVTVGGTSNQPPTAAFAHSCADLACTFTDGSSDGDGTVVAWSWSFGDGATSTAQSPAHTYAAAGTYTVSLTVTDDDGATNATSRQVTVSAPPPGAPTVSACTPASAHVNDQLVVQVTGSGFQPGATANFGDRIAVQKVDVVSPSALAVRIRVHARAAAGARAVTVTNPDGRSGTNATCFSVN